MASDSVPRPTPEEVRDHLHTIRSLMERANVYQTLSARAALIGGALASITGFGILLSSGVLFWWSPGDLTFVGIWLLLLIICTSLNLFLLAREARDRGDSFWSPGMRTALRAILPPMVVAGLFGIALIQFEAMLEYGVFLWIGGYGLALLAAGHFAPPAIRRLGYAFTVAAVACVLVFQFSGGLGFWPDPVTRASLFMGSTFGLLHLLHGILVIRRR